MFINEKLYFFILSFQISVCLVCVFQSYMSDQWLHILRLQYKIHHTLQICPCIVCHTIIIFFCFFLFVFINYTYMPYHRPFISYFLSISRQLECEFCDLKFITKKDIKRHLRDNHFNKREHMCHICGKKFVKKYVLEKHIFIHADQRPFDCKHCGKLFRTANNLKSHIGIHTGEHPFKCGICPRTFKFSSTAALHRRSHKIGEFYKCSVCMADFTATRYLFYHMRNFHKDVKTVNPEWTKRMWRIYVL